jgi:biotin synthase-related radical SAM superfamily protein
MLLDARKKAELISVGGVEIDEPVRSHLSRSTAGPGAGLDSFFFRSGSHRVRLGVRKSSPFIAVSQGGEVVILKNGKEFARGKIEDAIAHCPEQVYVTVSERCVFDCKFCPVPKLHGHIKTLEEVKKLADQGLAAPSFKAISITSGVWKSPEEEVKRVAEMVR